MQPSQSKPYQKPHLEQHAAYVLTTGLSLPISTSALGTPLEINDFLEEQQ